MTYTPTVLLLGQQTYIVLVTSLYFDYSYSVVALYNTNSITITMPSEVNILATNAAQLIWEL